MVVIGLGVGGEELAGRLAQAGLSVVGIDHTLVGGDGEILGVSSGLDYPPGAYATTAELAELANEAGRLGGIYHTHVRYALGDRFRQTHRITLYDSRVRDPDAYRVLANLSPEDRATAVDEARPVDPHPMQWAVLVPMSRSDEGAQPARQGGYGGCARV